MWRTVILKNKVMGFGLGFGLGFGPSRKKPGGDSGPSWTSKTDFSEYTIGEFPNDWELVGGNSSWTVENDENSPGGKALEHSEDADTYIQWVGEGQFTDVIAETVTQINGDDSNNLRSYIILRGVDGDDDGYLFGFRTNGTLYIRRRTGISSTIIASKPYDYIENSLVHIKAKAIGEEVKVKVWDYGEDEPSAWDLEVSDSEHSSGYCGLYKRSFLTKYHYFYIANIIE